MSSDITIPEYKSKQTPNLTDEEKKYLEDKFLSKSKAAFKIFRDDGHVRVVENGPYAGVIQTESTRLLFSTKVDVNLFYMLSFLKSEDALVFDSDETIPIKEGTNFFDVLGRMFYNELEAIVERGLLKRYVEKEENMKFLRGKLLVGQQIRNLNKPHFHIRYNDLTYDNTENRIILRALNLLIPLIRFNEALKFDLARMEWRFKEEVTFDPGISAVDCRLVCFDRLNERYRTIIDFSRLILEESFIRSTDRGEGRGFNFIVNMPKVYEDFVTTMFEETIAEHYGDMYDVIPQTEFCTLVDKGAVTVKPDIIVKTRGKEEYPLIIDAKYKRTEANADFFQMIAYSLAIPKASNCVLVYPFEDTKDKDDDYRVSKDISKGFEDPINLHTRTINLFEAEGDDFKAYVRKVKKEKILPILRAFLGA